MADELDLLLARLDSKDVVDEDYTLAAAAIRELREHQGEITVTTNAQGQCVAVTRNDDEGRVIKVIWQAPALPQRSCAQDKDGERWRHAMKFGFAVLNSTAHDRDHRWVAFALGITSFGATAEIAIDAALEASRAKEGK